MYLVIEIKRHSNVHRRVYRIVMSTTIIYTILGTKWVWIGAVTSYSLLGAE